MSARATSQCRSCGASIHWAITAEGKRMPLDANPDPNGNLVASRKKVGAGEELHVRAFMPGLELNPDGTRRNRWASHFKTCPQADAHRRSAAATPRAHVTNFPKRSRR